MTSVPLIVPTLSPSGAIHFAAVRREATAQDIIHALSVLDEVKEDILGDLQENAWAVQRIHRGLEGRLLSGTSKLADGLLDSTESISPLVASTKPPAMQRHFSAFPLSSHLHTPSLRLVSLHPLLRASLSCARIPDLEDDIELEWFLSRNTTVLDMVNGVIEELDLAKVIPGPGGGNVDYVLEEVWVSDQGDEIVSRLHDALLVSQIVETAVRDYPFPTKTRAKRILRFCVPDEWYRRSKSRSLSLTPIESGGTLRPNSEDGNSDEEGGTAKQRNKATGSSAMRRDAQESRQSGRFSLFEGWGTVSSTSSGTVALAHASPGDRNTISVSAPLAVMSPQQTGISAVFGQEMDLSEDNVSAEFERMMDDIGLKDDKREAMRSMPLERKQYLLMQSKQSRSTIGTSSQSQRQGSNQGSDSTQSAITPISPQVTGILRRFSLWGAPSGSPTVSSPAPEPESREPVQESLPIVPQITGSLWGNWWLGSPRETETPREGDRTKPNSTEWYVDGIRNGKTTDTRLAKHLISLRVHLSTAKVAWIERFLGEEKGMDALAALLQSLIDKGGKGRKLSDTEGIILLEVIKCLRVLLNTAPGYPYVIQSPTIITHIAFTLHGASPKLRALSSDLLAAICVISLNEGHRLVLGALSDYRVSFDERFRFDDLINALRIEENSTSQEGEQDGVWEARGATMGLIIALTSCSDSIEERILLREEFSRRGLNEVMVGLRYLKPPDSLLKQLDAYSEDKYEDEEDIRDQLRALARKQHGVNNNKADDPLDSWLQNLEVSSPETSASLRTTLKALSKLSEEATTSNFKMDILFICEKFVENAALLGDFEEHWVIFLDRFAEAIHHLIPKPFPSIKDEANGHVKDFELLQEQVRSMSTTISSLQNELAGQTAELDTLRSLSQSFESSQLPSKAPGKTGPNAEIRGFVTRLVQKEKQVAQLQADLVRLQSKSQAPQDAPEEQAKREREQMKIKKVTEELNALKSKNTELEGIIAAKAKEIVYLKRALESVYSRFHASAQESEQERRHGPESEVDVQSMTNHTIEGLAKKEEEIKALQDTVISLQAQLSNSHATTLDTSALEKQFKARTAPPPPPPIKPKKPASNGPLSATPQGTLASPTSNVSASFTNTSEQGQFMERTVESAKQEAGSRSDMSPAGPIPPPPPPPPPGPPAPPGFGIVSSPSSSPSPISVPGPPPPPPIPPAGFAAVFAAIPSSNVGMAPPPPPAPPAPPLGGPPPPPPPFGMPTRRPTMIKVPSKKLKPFFWTKLGPTQSSPTVWDDLGGQPVSLDVKELEEIFTVDTSAKSKIDKASKDTTKNQSLTTLLDITRANNVAIMLARIKLSNGEIRRALLELDEVRLSTDDLRAISRQLPTLDEISRLQDFGDLTKLSKADQYFGEVMRIPRISERLECTIYGRRLELELAEVRPDLDMVRNAAAEIKASKRLRKVLGTVLVVGNTLNGSTFRGGARGFQLDALLKMKETKTAKSGTDCPTLLHYLAKILMREDAGLIMFGEELSHVEAAARVSVQFILSTVNSLCQGMERVKDELEVIRSAQMSSEDFFIAKMEPFVRKMEPAVHNLRLSGQALETELQGLLLFFGEAVEGPEATKPEDFFNLVLSFSRALQKAALEVHDSNSKKQVPVVAIHSERADEEHSGTIKGHFLSPMQGSVPPSTQKLLSPPASHGRASGANTVGRGDVDQAIRSIRDGQRRARPHRPLSKMFLDGTGSTAGVRPISRAYD